MTERSIFWRRHLEAIDAEGISTVAYAERERLSLGSLYQWRQKLKSDFGIAISQAPTSSSGFVAVRVTEHYEANTTQFGREPNISLVCSPSFLGPIKSRQSLQESRGV